MSGEINVISRTQIIYVDPTSGSVSIVNAGPQGPAGPTGGATGPGACPTGMITMFGGTTAPSGWALCDGSAISRVSNAALFAVIGTAYGGGDGSTTFNLPDFRGRTAMGFNAGDPDFLPLGRAAGAKNHRHPLGGPGGGFAKIAVQAAAGTDTFHEAHITTPNWTSQLANNTPLTFENDPVVFARGVALGGSTDDGGGHPPNVAVNYIIKT